MMVDQLLNTSQLAFVLNVSKRRAREIVSHPDFPPAISLGERSRRWREDEVLAWLEQQRVVSGPSL